MDYEVVGPNEKLVMDGSKERQGDFVFTAGEPGEYRFCFNNEMSTFAEKFVDFEIAVSIMSHCFPAHVYMPFPACVDSAEEVARNVRVRQKLIMRYRIGRERSPSLPPLKTRNHSRTNQCT